MNAYTNYKPIDKTQELIMIGSQTFDCIYLFCI